MKKNSQFKLLSCALLVSANIASANESTYQNILNYQANGAPSFIKGQLGSLQGIDAQDFVTNYIKSDPSFGYSGAEALNKTLEWTDQLGKTHIRYKQSINGLKVYGTSVTLHLDGNANSNAYALTGAFGGNVEKASTASLRRATDGGRAATEYAKTVGNIAGAPELSYVYSPKDASVKLAWKIDVKYNDDSGFFQHDILFVDPFSNKELTRHPQVHTAKTYTTYDMQENVYNSSFRPGVLVCSTGESCDDESAQRAHDGASGVYDYFKEQFDRDGIDDDNLEMISSVHTGSNWNNATWYQNQMMYGDGDGTDYIDFTNAYDIIAHELTHGVIQFTAGLVYRNESGALNEAWADIFGVCAEARKNGLTSPSWDLGEDSSVTATPLRYMDDPTEDGNSYDYYPERYLGFQDNGGVHWNSGIANLAFSLLVDGGSHPRDKTDVVVDGIGMEKAEQIFYRALTTYFSENTNFSGARTGTIQAAEDLYGDTEVAALEDAWCAVGVGSCAGEESDNGGSNDNRPWWWIYLN